jgi:hypothetical protein
MIEFTRIVIDEEFEINDKKTRLQKEGQRQEVTGLIVNKKVNIAREYYRDIRSLLYIWKRYGKEQAYVKFFSRYITSNTYKASKNQMPSMQDVISGKLLFMKMVMGEDSSSYKNLRDKFIDLCPEHNVYLETNITYNVSYRLDEFESAFVDVSDFIGVLCIQFCGGKKYRREVQAKEASRSFVRSGRQESYCRTVTRAEEYRLCNLARIYLSDSGNSDHRRYIHVRKTFVLLSISERLCFHQR